jgi:hypothetical protein
MGLITAVFKRAFLFLFYPKEMYQKTDHDYASAHFLTLYVGILGLIPAIFTFLSLAFVKQENTVQFVMTKMTIIVPLLFLVSIIVSFWIISILIYAFARRMTSVNDIISVAKIVAYALTPILISAIFSPIPILNIAIAFFLIVYSIIMLIIGIRVILQPKVRPFFLYVLSILFFILFLLLDGWFLDLLMKTF